MELVDKYPSNIIGSDIMTLDKDIFKTDLICQSLFV